MSCDLLGGCSHCRTIYLVAQSCMQHVRASMPCSWKEGLGVAHQCMPQLSTRMCSRLK